MPKAIETKNTEFLGKKLATRHTENEKSDTKGNTRTMMNLCHNEDGELGTLVESNEHW